MLKKFERFLLLISIPFGIHVLMTLWRPEDFRWNAYQFACWFNGILMACVFKRLREIDRKELGRDGIRSDGTSHDAIR